MNCSMTQCNAWLVQEANTNAYGTSALQWSSPEAPTESLHEELADLGLDDEDMFFNGLSELNRRDALFACSLLVLALMINGRIDRTNWAFIQRASRSVEPPLEAKWSNVLHLVNAYVGGRSMNADMAQQMHDKVFGFLTDCRASLQSNRKRPHARFLYVPLLPSCLSADGLESCFCNLGSEEAFRMMQRSYEKIGSGTPYDLWAPDCPVFQLVDFHVKGRGRCQVLGTLDLVSWQVLADGELTGEPSALPCLQPEMQVRYLLVKAPDDAIVTPQGVCAGLIPPAAMRWSHSVPHQDASWVTLLVESSSGLLIKPNRLDSWQKVSFVQSGHLLVLAGAALALASQGHYPAPCHAVQVPSSFRLSWAWISPAHSCFYNPTHQMHLSQCGMVWRPNFTAPADCRDGNLLGGGMRGLLKRRSSLLPLELASAH
eukprot:s6581_g2.t2